MGWGGSFGARWGWHHYSIKPDMYRQEATMNIWYNLLPRKNTRKVFSHLLRNAPFVSVWIPLKKAICKPQSFLWCFLFLLGLFGSAFVSCFLFIALVEWNKRILNLLGFFFLFLSTFVITLCMWQHYVHRNAATCIPNKIDFAILNRDHFKCMWFAFSKETGLTSRTKHFLCNFLLKVNQL